VLPCILTERQLAAAAALSAWLANRRVSVVDRMHSKFPRWHKKKRA
jgi:hypothetical protein